MSLANNSYDKVMGQKNSYSWGKIYKQIIKIDKEIK